MLLKFYDGISKYMAILREEGNDSIVSIDIGDHYTLCDVAVFLGSWKERDRPWHEVRRSIAEKSGCFVVIETPLLNRIVDFQNNQYFRIGINGFLNNSGNFAADNADDLRLKDMNISWNGWNRDPDGNIVLFLQLPGDASLRAVDIYSWAEYTVNSIRSYTDRPIKIRTHPLHKPKDSDGFYRFATELLTRYKNVSLSYGNQRPLEKDLECAYCAVTYSSGTAIDSILDGVPVLTTDPGNFAWDISSHYINEIENLKLANDNKVVNWLQKLSYSQWSIEEMESGRAWQHLLPEIINITKSKKKK